MRLPKARHNAEKRVFPSFTCTPAGPNGEMSHDPATYAEIKRKIKEKSDILIHTTLGNLWNAGSDDKRLAHVLEAKPDIATIDIGSTNNDVYDFDKHEWETTENVYEKQR